VVAGGALFGWLRNSGGGDSVTAGVGTGVLDLERMVLTSSRRALISLPCRLKTSANEACICFICSSSCCTSPSAVDLSSMAAGRWDDTT
jgi:hypothetical protein